MILVPGCSVAVSYTHLALENSAEEVEFLTRFVDKGLRERLEHVKETPFVRCSYTAVSYTHLDVYKRQP